MDKVSTVCRVWPGPAAVLTVEESRGLCPQPFLQKGMTPCVQPSASHPGRPRVLKPRWQRTRELATWLEEKTH